MEIKDIDKCVEKGCELFKNGWNCSQSVFMAFADFYGIEPELAARLSASYGGGIGRMRLTCGAACGMFMLAGLETASADPADKSAKSANMKEVQALAAEFAKVNGKLGCQLAPGPDGSLPDKSKIKPCAEIVRNALMIYAEYLKNKRASAI